MYRPNLFLTYVTDAQASADFYRDLFGIEPNFTSPRYVSFEIAPRVLFAVWSGHNESTLQTATHTAEVGLMVPGTAETVDTIYAEWAAKGVTVLAEPHDAVFGRTFVVTDPDGNLIRVSPVD